MATGCKNVKTSHYVTVDGEPVCSSQATVGLDPASACQVGDLHSAIRLRKRLQRQLPGCLVEVVEGRCPAQGSGYEFD